MVAAKLSLVWRSLPAQLARENKKFIWGLVREGARAREYEDAASWLVESGLIRKVPLNDARGVPLRAYDSASAFKTYCLDVGLLRRMSGLDATAFAAAPALFSEFKGAFAENYVLQARAWRITLASIPTRRLCACASPLVTWRSMGESSTSRCIWWAVSRSLPSGRFIFKPANRSDVMTIVKSKL